MSTVNNTRGNATSYSTYQDEAHNYRFKIVDGIWLNIIMFIFGVILLLCSFYSFILIRWIYKNKLITSVDALVQKYKDEEKVQREVQLEKQKIETMKAPKPFKLPTIKCRKLDGIEEQPPAKATSQASSSTLPQQSIIIQQQQQQLQQLQELQMQQLQQQLQNLQNQQTKMVQNVPAPAPIPVQAPVPAPAPVQVPTPAPLPAPAPVQAPPLAPPSVSSPATTPTPPTPSETNPSSKIVISDSLLLAKCPRKDLSEPSVAKSVSPEDSQRSVNLDDPSSTKINQMSIKVSPVRTETVKQQSPVSRKSVRLFPYYYDQKKEKETLSGSSLDSIRVSPSVTSHNSSNSHNYRRKSFI